MYFQTCRRHPSAGRFLAECFMCKRELFDMEQANRADAERRAAARAALAIIGTPDARILSVTEVGGALVVATEQPAAYFPYAVDTFRLPTAAETDPEQVDAREPGQWILIDQYGDHTQDQIGNMVRDAQTYLNELGIAA